MAINTSLEENLLMKWFTPSLEKETKTKFFCLPNPFINRDGWRIGRLSERSDLGTYCIDNGFGHIFVDIYKDHVRDVEFKYLGYLGGYLYFWGEPDDPWDGGDEDNFTHAEWETIYLLFDSQDDKEGWDEWQKTHVWMKIS